MNDETERDEHYDCRTCIHFAAVYKDETSVMPVAYLCESHGVRLHELKDNAQCSDYYNVTSYEI